MAVIRVERGAFTVKNFKAFYTMTEMMRMCCMCMTSCADFSDKGFADGVNGFVA